MLEILINKILIDENPYFFRYLNLILTICTKEILKPDLIILRVIPVIMVGILGLYSLLVAFI